MIPPVLVAIIMSVLAIEISNKKEEQFNSKKTYEIYIGNLAIIEVNE